MLQHVSWQQYLTALIIMTSAWYLFVLLRYYRAEIAEKLNKRPLPTPPADTRIPEIMGKARTDGSSEALTGEEICFADSATPDDISDRTEFPGPADALLGEARVLIHAFRENDDKAGFLSLLRTLVGQYELHREEIDLNHVTGTLQENAGALPFPITKKEWSLSWPEH